MMFSIGLPRFDGGWFIPKTLTSRTAAFYNSSYFHNMAEEAAPFLNQLGPYVGGRQVSLENMVCLMRLDISS